MSHLRIPPELEEFATQIGEFMEYWGFKKIHGQMWAHIYLSSELLDAGQLIQRLGISKALASITLKELIGYGVIEEAGKSLRGTKIYRAREDLIATILDTIRRRERKMLARIQAAQGLLEKLEESDLSNFGIEKKRVEHLGLFIRTVDNCLDNLLSTQGIHFLNFLQSSLSQASRPQTSKYIPGQKEPFKAEEKS